VALFRGGDMTPSVSTAKTNWLDLQSKLIPKKYRESNVCVAGGMKVIEFYTKLHYQTMSHHIA
jgi:hypothetical protein